MNRRFCIAPMMEWTDRHFRYFARLLSAKTLLYTEMVTTGAILFGNDESRFLAYNEQEHPLALQLGGSNPEHLAQCTAIAESYGYDEVNLNVGCPSDRVQNNMIGACLMAHKELVAQCIESMQAASTLPVTIKHRIGIDEFDSYDFLQDFVGTISQTGCRTFIVHARIALLNGLSPKENREVPPLHYDYVYRLKKAFPNLEIIINGGIGDLNQSIDHLNHVDGVMLGRAVYHNPWLLSEVDKRIFNEASPIKTRHDVIRAMFPYIEQQLSNGVKLNHITRHILNLFHGQPSGKRFRRHLSERAHLAGTGLETLEQALALVPENP